MFGNASISGTAAGIYVVIYQPAQASQGLMRVKSQLSKKDLAISRFKFVAMHMDANRYQDLKSNLEGKPIRNIYGWTDSSTALHWVRSEDNFKHFVSNRVK